MLPSCNQLAYNLHRKQGATFQLMTQWSPHILLPSLFLCNKSTKICPLHRMNLKNGQNLHLQFFSRVTLQIYQRYSSLHSHSHQPLYKNSANDYKSYSYRKPQLQPLQLLTFSLVYQSPPPYINHMQPLVWTPTFFPQNKCLPNLRL